MKLKEYIKTLIDIEKDHPDAKLVYACDEEGNRFSEVFYQPAAGCYNGCDWLTEGDLEHEDGEVNAVLLN